ncbi:hypothetical protein GCM10028771_26850 [Nocardioides marmoraquaticus]
MPAGLARLVGGPDDLVRPLRLLLAIAVLLSLPTVVFAVVTVVSDLRERTEEMDGLGLVVGVVLLLWVGVVVLLCGLALRLRRRRTASGVLGVLGGLGTLWVSTATTVWTPLPAPVGVPLGWACVLLGLAAVALAVVAARR